MEITKEKYKEILEIQMIPYNEKSRWFEETLTKINQALQLQQTGVSKCVFCDNKPYKKGAAYCERHMASDDYS